MTDQSTIFAQEPSTPAAAPTETPAPSTLEDRLNAIKNERGEVKYSTVEDALQGAAHAQLKIQEDAVALQKLQADLQAAQLEAATLKGALDTTNLLSPPPPTPMQESTPADSLGLSEEQTKDLFLKMSAQQTAEQTQAANIGSVVRTLKEKFGDKAEEAFYNTASQLNMTKEQMNQIAATSPKAALAFFTGVKADDFTPTQTSVSAPVTPPVVSNGVLEHSGNSMLVGATSGDLKAEMARHKEAVYAKYNIA